jgi:Zn-dependent metalloprotease
MRDHRPRQQVWSIVPPHMLEAIAQNGTPEQRQMAMATLSADLGFRAERLVAEGASGTSVASAGAGSPHKNRSVFSADNGTSLPGTLKRSEGAAATGDAAVDEAYDGLGGTFDLYWEVFGRDSIDGNGMALIATVHYGNSYNNAFWDGSQMVFGDGDGVIFNRFTIAPDVEGHELTHGVTGATAGLEYHDQPGALNESLSDCFGSMVKQRMNGQTSAQADWLIGQGLLAAGIHGVALRSMKAPGTAYDDPTLGKDPQPDHMSRYVNTSSDNGGVHINSGIPNKAFYLVATGLGGNSWDRAGPIWYRTLTASGLSATASFADFAKLTADNANSLYGSAVRDVVVQAWRDVGIDLATVASWYYDKAVLSTFTSPHSMNAWAYIEDLGWRKIQPLTPDGVTNMFDLLTESQASGRKVHVYADGSLIYQAYSV